MSLITSTSGKCPICLALEMTGAARRLSPAEMQIIAIYVIGLDAADTSEVPDISVLEAALCGQHVDLLSLLEEGVGDLTSHIDAALGF